MTAPTSPSDSTPRTTPDTSISRAANFKGYIRQPLGLVSGVYLDNLHAAKSLVVEGDQETKTLPGYTIDPGTQSQTVVVNSADTQTITFYNTPGTTL